MIFIYSKNCTFYTDFVVKRRWIYLMPISLILYGDRRHTALYDRQIQGLRFIRRNTGASNSYFSGSFDDGAFTWRPEASRRPLPASPPFSGVFKMRRIHFSFHYWAFIEVFLLYAFYRHFGCGFINTKSRARVINFAHAYYCYIIWFRFGRRRKTALPLPQNCSSSPLDIYQLMAWWYRYIYYLYWFSVPIIIAAFIRCILFPFINFGLADIISRRYFDGRGRDFSRLAFLPDALYRCFILIAVFSAFWDSLSCLLLFVFINKQGIYSS